MLTTKVIKCHYFSNKVKDVKKKNYKIPHFYIHWLLKKTYKRGDISQKPKGLKGGETLPLLIGFQME